MKISFLLSVIALSFSFCPLAKAQSSGGVTSPEVWFRTVPATSNLQGYYLWKDFSERTVSKEAMLRYSNLSQATVIGIFD